MDWDCFNWSIRMKDLLLKYHGQIDVENSIKYIIGELTSGNLQIVLYDLTEMNFYVSYGYQDTKYQFKKNAFERPFIKFNARELFNEKL